MFLAGAIVFEIIGTNALKAAAFLVFRERPDLPAVLGMGLIILGVVVINVFSKTVSH